MTEIITAEAISRRKALTLLGLATAAFAASSVVAAPDAEAQTVGMERRQGRRTGRQEQASGAGALAAQRGVKKGASDYHPDARAGYVQKTVRPCPRGSHCCEHFEDNGSRAQRRATARSALL